MYDKTSLLRNLSFLVSKFFDSSEPRPLYKRVQNFSLLIVVSLFIADLNISDNNLITFIMGMGSLSILTYLAFLGLGLWLFLVFVPKIYFGWQNRKPKSKKPEKILPKVISNQPTSWDWKDK